MSKKANSSKEFDRIDDLRKSVSGIVADVENQIIQLCGETYPITMARIMWRSFPRFLCRINAAVSHHKPNLSQSICQSERARGFLIAQIGHKCAVATLTKFASWCSRDAKPIETAASLCRRVFDDEFANCEMEEVFWPKCLLSMDHGLDEVEFKAIENAELLIDEVNDLFHVNYGRVLPWDPFDPVRFFAREKLPGICRQIVEQVCMGRGTVPLSQIAERVGWTELRP